MTPGLKPPQVTGGPPLVVSKQGHTNEFVFNTLVMVHGQLDVPL